MKWEWHRINYCKCVQPFFFSIPNRPVGTCTCFSVHLLHDLPVYRSLICVKIENGLVFCTISASIPNDINNTCHRSARTQSTNGVYGVELDAKVVVCLYNDGNTYTHTHIRIDTKQPILSTCISDNQQRIHEWFRLTTIMMVQIKARRQKNPKFRIHFNKVFAELFRSSNVCSILFFLSCFLFTLSFIGSFFFCSFAFSMAYWEEELRSELTVHLRANNPENQTIQYNVLPCSRYILVALWMAIIIIKSNKSICYISRPSSYSVW